MQKIKCNVGRKDAKNAVFIGENGIFYLKKMKQIGNSESVSNAADWLTIIQRRVRDFSSAKHQRTQPMKNVLGGVLKIR